MPKKVTLKDVAALTGVTTASVSMILNGKDLNRFTPETVTRVIAAAQTLGYVSPSARHEQKQIAILSPSVNNPYHTTIIMGIERAALASGYLTGIYNTYWNPQTELTLLRQLEKRRVAGIIYVMNPLQAEKAREIDRHTPVVAVGDIVNDIGIDTVDVNNFRAAEIVAEHLIQLGHKHIAYLTTSLNDHHIARVRRCEGLQDTFRRLCPEGSVTVFCPEITGIVAINDMVGFGVLDGLIEAGKRVPEDYSLCGFDNVFPSGFQRMQLTTVDHGTIYHGARAFHLLKDRMETVGPHSAAYPITRVEYRSKLVERGSTGKPRT